jgi:hypothetical protein
MHCLDARLLSTPFFQPAHIMLFPFLPFSFPSPACFSFPVPGIRRSNKMVQQRPHRPQIARAGQKTRLVPGAKPKAAQQAAVARVSRLRPTRYKPLDTTQLSFRLISLNPGEKTETIRCDLFNSTVSTWCGNYTAGSFIRLGFEGESENHIGQWAPLTGYSELS